MKTKWLALVAMAALSLMIAPLMPEREAPVVEKSAPKAEALRVIPLPPEVVTRRNPVEMSHSEDVEFPAINFEALLPVDCQEIQKPLGERCLIHRVSEAFPSSAAPAPGIMSDSLAWLARHQSPNGSWSPDGYCPGGKCAGAGLEEHTVATTALSLLAFVSAGFQTEAGVLRGLRWLIAQQDREGRIGTRDGSKHMLGHVLATLSICETLPSYDVPILREKAQRAVDFILLAQNPGRGWRYSVRPGDNDSIVTGWTVMALKSAERARINVNAKAFQGALAWFDEATEKSGRYRVGYNHRSGSASFTTDNGQWSRHSTSTALGIASRKLINGAWKDPALEGIRVLLEDLPRSDDYEVDACHWYVGTVAMALVNDVPSWSKWAAAARKAIHSSQTRLQPSCSFGSWNPADDRWGKEAGRVAVTALNSMTMSLVSRSRP